MAHRIAAGRDSVYLDLESPRDREKLSDPQFYLSGHEEKLVVLDEVQRIPELFATLRGLIDTGRRRGRKFGRFLLLGSASADLLRQSETLAGRIAYIELSPLDVSEVPRKKHTDLWVRGGFPESFLAPDVARSLVCGQVAQGVCPAKRFVVNSGTERYSISEGVEAIGLAEMAATLLAICRH